MSTNDKVTCSGVSENTGVSSDSVACSDVKEKKCNRKVSFPLDDEIVTQYFEPSNPWQDVPSTTRAQLAAEYLEACRCHNTPAIESVLQQIRELPENTIGGSMRAPRLALSDCSLLGTAPADALEALLRKVQFRRLELDHAEIDDEGAEALFDMVEYYESTTVLCLIGPRQFGIRGWQAASRMIKKSAELSEIEISESPLEANHAPVLARSLRPASCRLRSVCLQRAALAGDPLLCLVIALKTNNSVRELRLGDNRLSASDAAQIANLLRYNTHLQLLDLSNNQIQDAGVDNIAEALVAQSAHSPPSPHQCPLGGYESRGLAFLVLWNNQLTRNCAGHLAKILRASQSLCVLNVGRNALGSDVVRALQTDRIGGGPLVSLGLQAARLGPDAARAIADLIRNDTKLQRLDLRDNKLGAAGLQAILNAMKENTTLTQIDLDDPAETTTSVGVQSCTESATVARLLRDIRALCHRNEPAAPAPPDRLLRKISLTCHTAPAPKQQSLPAEEERKVRLRSPAPSPAPSPAGSPVPAGQGHSRFSVIPVTSDRASVSTDSTNTQAPRSTHSPTASRFKVVQVADPPQIQVQHTPRKTRFSVTRNYDTTYNPTLPPTTPSPSPSPSPSSSPAPEINLDYNPDNLNTDKSSNVHENKPIFDYTRDTNNAHTLETDKGSNITQNEPIFDYTTDNNKNNAKQEEEISIDLKSMLITDAKSIVKTEQSKNDIKQGDLNKNDTKQMKNDIKNVTVSMKDGKSCEQIIKTEIKNDNIVIKLDNTAKAKDSNIMQHDSNIETKDNNDIKLDTATKAKVIQDGRVTKEEITKNPKVTHDEFITDTTVKPKFVEETEPQYVVTKTVLLPKTENRTVLTQTEEIMNIPEFVSDIQQEIKSENKTTKDENVCKKGKNGDEWDSGVDKNIETIVIREDLKDKPERIAKDLKESSKSVNMPESVINEPKFDPELISNLGPEITHVTEFYEKPEKLAAVLGSISNESESKDVISNIDVKVSDSNKTVSVSSLNNEKLKATTVIGDGTDNLELINISSDTNKFSESGESERFGDKIEQMSHNETVDYVGDDKIVKTETKLVKSSIEASETDRVETEVSVTVRSENSLKTKVHRDQNVNKLAKEEKREVAIKQIEAITEDLGNIIQEMQDLSTKTIKKTATEDVNIDIGVNNVPANRDSVVLKKNRSESSLDSPDLEVSRLMRKPVSAFCDSSSSLEISGSSVESLNVERAKPIIIHEETRMSKESSVESTSEITPVNLNVSISSNESVSPIIFGITKKIHGSLSSLEASMSSVDSARHEKVMVTSADSGIEYSLQNPSEIREDSSSNEGTLTCSSSLKESVKKESNETLTSPKRTSSLLDVPALKSKGLDRMRKISWVAPSASFHLPRPEERVEYKLPTNLEKLLSLFQHPSSLFSRNNSDDEKKSTSSTPPRKDSSLTSSFWSWGSVTEKADKDDADSLSEATDSTLSERVQVSFVDESFSRKLDSKTPSTDTDNTLSEFQTFPNSGESLPNTGVSNHNRGEILPDNGESAKVTELTTDDKLVQKPLALRDNDACPDEPGACDIIDLITPNDLNRNVTQTSEKLESGDRADTAECSETLVKLEDEKVDVRPRTFASVLTSSSENSLEKQSSPETGHPVDKLPSKVIRGIKENISPENTLTSSITTKALAMELGERQTKNKAVVNAVWEVTMPCAEKSEPKTEDVKTQSVLAPIATIDETSDVAADDLIQLAYIDDAKVEERVFDIEKDTKAIEKLAVDKVDLGKDALSYLMDEIPNEDFERETAHSMTEAKSPQGSLAQELRDAEIKEMLDLSPELVIDDAVEIPEIFTVEIKGRKSSPVIPERAKLKKSNSLEDLTKRPVEDKESPKLKTIAFKVPESTTPRDIPERRSKLRSRSGSSPKSLPESLNKPCPLTKMDSVISKKKKKASSLGKTARDSLLMLNMSEEEIAEFRRPYKLTSVESLRSLESVSEDANSQSGTSVDSRCRACLRTSQESLMSLDSITEDCRCMEECEKRHSNR